MVLFLTGDLSFCLADWCSWRMAASATGSVPLSMSSSVSDDDSVLFTMAPADPATGSSETRRSDSLDFVGVAFWVDSEGDGEWNDFLCGLTL